MSILKFIKNLVKKDDLMNDTEVLAGWYCDKGINIDFLEDKIYIKYYEGEGHSFIKYESFKDSKYFKKVDNKIFNNFCSKSPKQECDEILNVLEIKTSFTIEICKSLIWLIDDIDEVLHSSLKASKFILKKQLPVIFNRTDFSFSKDIAELEYLLSFCKAFLKIDPKEDESVCNEWCSTALKILGEFESDDEELYPVFAYYDRDNMKEGCIFTVNSNDELEKIDFNEITFLKTNIDNSCYIVSTNELIVCISNYFNDIEKFEEDVRQSGMLGKNNKVLGFIFKNINDFLLNPELFLLCRDKNLISEENIYSVVASDADAIENIGNNFGEFASKTASNLFGNFFGTIKDAVSSVVKNTVCDKKALVLVENKVLYVNLDKEDSSEFKLKEVAEFKYKKDKYVPNTIDIYENGLDDEPFMNNVSMDSYKRFMTELQNLLQASNIENHIVEDNSKKIDKKSRLLELKELFNDGLIDEDEYKAQKQIILNE